MLPRESASRHDHEHGTSFKHLTTCDKALQLVLSKLPKRALEAEKVPVQQALGRILSKDVVAQAHVPAFDRAAMDGFAVNAEDTYGASISAPVFLHNVGEIRIEEKPNLTLKRAESIAIVTGGQMPQGANAIVMIEHTRAMGKETVEITSEVHPAENVSRAGEDVERGSIVMTKGTRLLPQDLGMLRALGLVEIEVAQKPRVAVLSTGNELTDGDLREGNRIPDINRPTLMGALTELACEPVDLGIVPDQFDSIRDKLVEGIRDCDMVLVTAGTSVGPRDMVPNIIDSIGKPGMLVHGIAIRPSMPTGLAVVDGKPIVSLPGYPVSAYISFLEFVHPLICHILDTNLPPRPRIRARLNRRIAGVLGSRTYVRVKVTMSNGVCMAEPVRTSGAGILSSLVQANGFIIIPENVEGYEEDHEVEVELFRPLERKKSVN
ncbi:MAG TPA: gephyrin-like molybdotransferase Glp [Terriglobales bacterium]|nr:gephyrin-like molybdotransferase Glp [Terriglobales bacterium]